MHKHTYGHIYKYICMLVCIFMQREKEKERILKVWHLSTHSAFCYRQHLASSSFVVWTVAWCHSTSLFTLAVFEVQLRKQRHFCHWENELFALAHWVSPCQAQHSSGREQAVSPVVPRLSHRATARQWEQEFEPRTERRGCCSSELRWLGSLPRVAAGAHCQLLAVPFLLIWCPGASPPSFLGQNSFWQIFLSCLMGVEESRKLLQIEFCSSIAVRAASQQTCWMSHFTGLWVTDLSCHVRPQGRWGGRDPPSHSHCVGKGCALIGKPRFLHALWPLSVKASHWCTLGSNSCFTQKSPEKLDKVISGRSGIFSKTFVLPKLSFWYLWLTG